LAIEEIVMMKQLGEVEMQYVYKLTKGEYNEKEAYGIKVERKDIVNGEVINMVSDEVKIISNLKDKVRCILEKLSINEVSPIHLVDIIGEEVDNCVFDF
jgi:hypothetical protein